MSNIKIQLIDPIKIIKSRIKQVYDLDGEFMFSHIKYNKDVNEDYDYQIIRESTHDGAMLFTFELTNQCLVPVVNKTSYCISNAPEDLNSIKDIIYTIGDIKLESDFGTKSINGREMRGQTDTVYLPVKIQYILKI